MNKLTEIRALLWQMRLKVSKHLAAKGLTIDDPEFAQGMEELSVINQTLEIPLRDLRSAQHAASVRERNLWNIPRDKRYGPKSSVAGQQKEIEDLTREARDLQKLVEDLLKRVAGGNEMEGVHTVAELIEKVTGHESGDAEQVMPDRPAYVPYAPGHFQGSPESAVIMAYVAIRALILLVKRGKSRS